SRRAQPTRLPRTAPDSVTHQIAHSHASWRVILQPSAAFACIPGSAHPAHHRSLVCAASWAIFLAILFSHRPNLICAADPRRSPSSLGTADSPVGQELVIKTWYGDERAVHVFRVQEPQEPQ